MFRAHKEDARVFLLSELCYASISRLVEDETGNTVGILASAMSRRNDLSTPNYFSTDCESFHPASCAYRDFPPTVIMSVDETTVETDPERIGALHAAVKKWRELATKSELPAVE